MLGPWAKMDGLSVGDGKEVLEAGASTSAVLELVNYDMMFQRHRQTQMEKLNKQVVNRNLTYVQTGTETDTQKETDISIIYVDEELARLVKQPAGSKVSFWELRRVLASRFHLPPPSL